MLEMGKEERERERKRKEKDVDVTCENIVSATVFKRSWREWNIKQANKGKKQQLTKSAQQKLLKRGEKKKETTHTHTHTHGWYELLSIVYTVSCANKHDMVCWHYFMIVCGCVWILNGSSSGLFAANTSHRSSLVYIWCFFYLLRFPIFFLLILNIVCSWIEMYYFFS